jgi:hypothetical protein
MDRRDGEGAGGSRAERNDNVEPPATVLFDE